MFNVKLLLFMVANSWFASRIICLNHCLPKFAWVVCMPGFLCAHQLFTFSLFLPKSPSIWGGCRPNLLHLKQMLPKFPLMRRCCPLYFIFGWGCYVQFLSKGMFVYFILYFIVAAKFKSSVAFHCKSSPTGANVSKSLATTNHWRRQCSVKLSFFVFCLLHVACGMLHSVSLLFSPFLLSLSLSCRVVCLFACGWLSFILQGCQYWWARPLLDGSGSLVLSIT